MQSGGEARRREQRGAKGKRGEGSRSEGRGATRDPACPQPPRADSGTVICGLAIARGLSEMQTCRSDPPLVHQSSPIAAGQEVSIYTGSKIILDWMTMLWCWLPVTGHGGFPSPWGRPQGGFNFRAGDRLGLGRRLIVSTLTEHSSVPGPSPSLSPWNLPMTRRS